MGRDRVVDREHVVLLIGKSEEQLIVNFHQLPKGAAEGSWLKIRREAEEVVYMEFDQEEIKYVQESKIQAR
jgi:hypothetical protein